MAFHCSHKSILKVQAAEEIRLLLSLASGP
jgi:hypothetical protein